MQVFSKTWFLSNQKRIVKFANTFVGRLVFGVPYKNITQVLPHAITWREGNKFKTDVRTREEFGKRLYYKLKPLWYFIHGWDMLVANNLNEKWNYGFDTTTVYPDADPETTSVDGISGVDLTSSTLATLRNHNGNHFNDSSASRTFYTLQAINTSNLYRRMDRGIFTFDTSFMISGRVITAGTFSFRCTSKKNTFPSTDMNYKIHGANTSFGTALTNTSYLAARLHGTASPISDDLPLHSVISTSVFNDFVLNAQGRDSIDKDGITNIILKSSAEIFVTWGFNAIASLTILFSENGVSTSPKLVIEYDPAIPDVNTTGVSGISLFTVTFDGDVVSDSGAPITERGFVYATTINPTIANTKVVVAGGVGNYSSDITGLPPNTTYYVRAFATNSEGTVYGDNIEFKTDENKASMITISTNPITFP